MSSPVIALKNRLIETYTKQQGLVVMPSHLRVESTIKNSKSRYVFPLSNTKKPDVDPASDSGVWQRQLDRNNEFHVTKMGIFIYQVDTTAPVSVLQTFPSSGHFTGGTNFSYADLERLYSAGRLYVSIDGRVYIDRSVPVSNFRYVPEFQKTAAGNESQTAPNRGFINSAIEMTFAGNKQNDVEINCDAFSGINWEQDAADTEVRLVVMFEGFEVVGVQS